VKIGPALLNRQVAIPSEFESLPNEKILVQRIEAKDCRQDADIEKDKGDRMHHSQDHFETDQLMDEVLLDYAPIKGSWGNTL
jgi:hypothetical protein